MPALPRFGLPAGDDEIAQYTDIVCVAFGAPPDEIRPKMEKLDPTMIRVLRHGREVAGGLLLYSVGQWFGGRCLPMGAIGAVVVAPQFRGRGTATRLMKEIVAELHEKGVALSALYPATMPLYRRAGYEIAGSNYEIRLFPQTFQLRDRDLELREIRSKDTARVRAAYRRRVSWTNGPLDQSAHAWQQVLEVWRDPTRGYAVWNGEEIEGYIRYRPKIKQSTLIIPELIATTRAAGRRLLTFLADHRMQVETAIDHGNPSEPLLAELNEPRYRVKLRDHWMLRIVDVPRALSGRGYSRGVEGTVHFEIRDDLLPTNHGRFRLDVSEGRGRVRRGGRGSVKIDIRGLAPLFSGHLSPMELRGLTPYLDASPAQTAKLQPIFAGPLPWMPDGF